MLLRRIGDLSLDRPVRQWIFGENRVNTGDLGTFKENYDLSTPPNLSTVAIFEFLPASTGSWA